MWKKNSREKDISSINNEESIKTNPRSDELCFTASKAKTVHKWDFRFIATNEKTMLAIVQNDNES